MTKKDYALVAGVIMTRGIEARNRSIRAGEYFQISERRGIVSDLSRAFMADNPRFKPEEFVKACGF